MVLVSPPIESAAKEELILTLSPICMEPLPPLAFLKNTLPRKCTFLPTFTPHMIIFGALRILYHPYIKLYISFRINQIALFLILRNRAFTRLIRLPKRFSYFLTNLNSDSRSSILVLYGLLRADSKGWSKMA